jgi:hypothetical protein
VVSTTTGLAECLAGGGFVSKNFPIVTIFRKKAVPKKATFGVERQARKPRRGPERRISARKGTATVASLGKHLVSLKAIVV